MNARPRLVRLQDNLRLVATILNIVAAIIIATGIIACVCIIAFMVWHDLRIIRASDQAQRDREVDRLNKMWNADRRVD